MPNPALILPPRDATRGRRRDGRFPRRNFDKWRDSDTFRRDGEGTNGGNVKREYRGKGICGWIGGNLTGGREVIGTELTLVLYQEWGHRAIQFEWGWC